MISVTSAAPVPAAGVRSRQIHIIGAGPVGLFLTALLQSVSGLSVRLYEKRVDYVRTRMVRLSSHLDADVHTHADRIDRENIDAVFEPDELESNLAFKQSIPSDLMARIKEWTRGFCPLNTIERSLSDLIDTRRSGSVERVAAQVTAGEAMSIQAPGDVIVDCSGSNSLLRDHLAPASDATGIGPANTVNVRLEYAVVVTFLYGQAYDCNERCKYYKNIDNVKYKFIPAFDRTFYDGSISHVTGIISITAEDYDRMPKKFDGHWLRQHFPEAANSMDRFIGKIKVETNGEIIGDLDLLRIPLDLYHARNYTSRGRLDTDHPFARTPVFLVGDAAIGSPYFQSISLGLENAMCLASLLARRDLSVEAMFDRYELFAYKQWLRVYMRSKLIKHNKDIFESIDDRFAVLEQLHIF
jgi:2-polyprenyl-6-methoxyphenol hydroxylase-like FAD-dependent oxidoreductase